MIQLQAYKLFNEGFIKSLNGCWEWNKFINNEGYGRAWDGTKQILAHRLSYQIFKGNIPKGKVVMHSCDNRKCVNPAHLSLGTYKDNIQDAINKNRFNNSFKNLQKKDKNNRCLNCNESLSDRRFNGKYCEKCIVNQRKLTHARWQKANREHLNKYKRELRKKN